MRLVSGEKFPIHYCMGAQASIYLVAQAGKAPRSAAMATTHRPGPDTQISPRPARRSPYRPPREPAPAARGPARIRRRGPMASNGSPTPSHAPRTGGPQPHNHPVRRHHHTAHPDRHPDDDRNAIRRRRPLSHARVWPAHAPSGPVSLRPRVGPGGTAGKERLSAPAMGCRRSRPRRCAAAPPPACAGPHRAAGQTGSAARYRCGWAWPAASVKVRRR